MLLVIDCGNTNTVFALFDDDNKKGEWRVQTDARRTADEHGVWLTQLLSLEGLAPADVTGAVIASVVPQSTFSLDSLCRRYFAVEPLVVGLDIGTTKICTVVAELADEIHAQRTLAAAERGEHGALVRAGLLVGKSIGFLATRTRAATAAEIRARPELARARQVISEWLLLEYACVFLPANPETLVLPENAIRALGERTLELAWKRLRL